jgi:carbamoyltransferase
LEYASFPAVVHYDNTSRVQTVNKTDNPQFRALLELWYAKTGCPMLLNTSLNIKGQAMVNDHADAKSWSQLHGLPVFN